MSWLIALVFFAIGWFLIAEFDQSFFGFLMVIVGVLSLFMGSKSKSHAQSVHALPASQYPYQQPVIVKAGHGNKYQQVKLRVHSPWDSAKGFEDNFMFLGNVVLWPFKVLWRLLRMGKGGKG